MIEKVTAPSKIVTDKLVLKRLAEQGINKDYVEFWHDYALHSKGKEYSPYAKFYRDPKSNKRFMVVSGLPMVNADGDKVEAGWDEIETGKKYKLKTNIFDAEIEGKLVKLVCLSDQPNGSKKDEQVTWEPQLFIDGSEIISGEQPTLLPTDPVNENYKENTLEWQYGAVCKRRIRVIEGRFRERWVFESNPHSRVRIKHNFNGNLKLKLGLAIDAGGIPLKISVIGDEEIVEASEFDRAIYPVEIGAEETFYPDAHEETSSVDGTPYHNEDGLSWALLRAGAGTNVWDGSASYVNMIVCMIPRAGVSNEWKQLYRGITLFDTAGLPDSATITAVVLSLYGYNKADDVDTAPDINIYSSAPASNTDVVAGDFNSLGTTDYATAITYASWLTAGYNDFTFNATGRAAISKTNVSKFGQRMAYYDAAGNQPTWKDGVYPLISGLYFYSADQGNGFKPKLVVTYAVPTPVTDGDLIGIPVIRKS